MLSTMGARFNLVLVFVVYYAASASTQDTYITIPLNKSITFENREIYGGFLTLNSLSTVKVNFTNINQKLMFIVLQAHSHFHNVTLYATEKLPNSTITGTNVGLVSFMEPKPNTFYLQNSDVNATFLVYISVHGYTELDPIPGGCNMELSVPISPYLVMHTFNDYILVEAASPSVDVKCSDPNIATLTFYMMYLPEMNFNTDVYFDGIQKMMTWENIVRYGHKIPESSWKMPRRMLSAYPGTGTIYAVVATRFIDNVTMYSIYVPSHTYGCTNVGEDGCGITDDMFSQLLCAALLFVGAFVSFFGHRFFKTGMFLAGFSSGVIVSYILIALITVVDKPALLAASTISGIFFGAIWLLFWWLYGIPVIAVLLPSLNLGFLLAAIFYYRLPGHQEYLEENFNFWSPFVLVMLLTALALVSVTYAANIICCAVLGAYATVLSVDYYLGSNLKFIVINTIRRAIVPNFSKATLSPPFQLRDLSVTLLWVLLATLGFFFQHWHNRGRPPFPPPPRNVRPSMPHPAMYYGSITNGRPLERGINATPVPPTANTERTALLA